MSTIAFWTVIVCVVIGGIIGLLGIWMDGFWNNKLVEKLAYTDCVVCVTAIVLGIVNWLLGTWR